MHSIASKKIAPARRVLFSQQTGALFRFSDSVA
jgi:hypothetical protein